MSEPFRGTAFSLDQKGIAEVLDKLSVEAAEL
jgi:N-acetylmuramidase